MHTIARLLSKFKISQYTHCSAISFTQMASYVIEGSFSESALLAPNIKYDFDQLQAVSTHKR